MSDESRGNPEHSSESGNTVEMPRPSVAPLVVALGTTLLLAGLALSTAISIVGAVILAIGIGTWIANLLPGRGHEFEPLGIGPLPVVGRPGTVARLEVGMPGYRMRLPEKVRPISAGIKGGIWGGIVMPLPALAYSLASGHGIWYPLNLLAGIALPGVGEMPTAELQKFQLPLFVVGVGAHIVISVTLGLLYGVLLPTLPAVSKPIAWGGVLMPVLWTAASYSAMAVINPALNTGVDWPWFIGSQFVFGLVSAVIFMESEAKLGSVASGAVGGLCGGLLMPLPALIWSVSSGHGIWYPANLLAAMVRRGMDKLPVEELMRFNADWLGTAIVIHVAASIVFGLAYGIVLPKLPSIRGPFVWGGLLMPILWTAASFGLMGVVNPALQVRVNWPWFIASQFVFGLVAAIAIVRAEEILVPPAGRDGRTITSLG